MYAVLVPAYFDVSTGDYHPGGHCGARQVFTGVCAAVFDHWYVSLRLPLSGGMGRHGKPGGLLGDDTVQLPLGQLLWLHLHPADGVYGFCVDYNPDVCHPPGV